MNLTDYQYPEDVRPKRRRRAVEGDKPTLARPIGAILAIIGAGALIIVIVAMITYQLAHPPKPLGLYQTTMGTAEPSQPSSTPAPSPTVQALAADPRYDRRLDAGVMGGFGVAPRDLDLSGRRFLVLRCAGWDCYIELDDGARVWIAVDQAGEPPPTPIPLEPPHPPPTPRQSVMVCADATGINGQAHVCALDGDYATLLQQAQAQAGPPIGQPPTIDPNVAAAATQQAINQDATAYTVQTAQAQPTPVAQQQAR